VKTRRRRTHVFRIVLSHSRKAYSEVVYCQTTDDFIRCLENAFHHFGGVPKTLVIDNLKAAVTKADWYDPELNPKIQSFCARYGTVILPTKPRMPRHKGKVERIVGYVQNNALKARTFTGLANQNLHLLEWETHVANTRIHGTTRKQVKKAFEDVERASLLPLPVERFPSFVESRRKVNRDRHIEVDKAYYSVPPEYLGREVWVRWDSRTVRIFNHRFEQEERCPESPVMMLQTRHFESFSPTSRKNPRRACLSRCVAASIRKKRVNAERETTGANGCCRVGRSSNMATGVSAGGRAGGYLRNGVST